MSARKVSIPSIVKMLADAGKPYRLTQDKEGNTILEGLTAPITLRPVETIREKMAKRIDEIPGRSIRS